MKPEDREQYVKYRIESAYKTMDAAKVLAKNGFWNSAVNRLYYSAYFAVNALLVQNEIYTQSHAGTKNQFSLLFIKTKKIDIKYGKLFSELFDWRQKGDYENLFEYDAESVEPLFQPVLELIKLIDKELCY